MNSFEIIIYSFDYIDTLYNQQFYHFSVNRYLISNKKSILIAQKYGSAFISDMKLTRTQNNPVYFMLGSDLTCQ